MRIRSVSFTGIAWLSLAFLVSVTAGQARAAFENGDLYLVTPAYPTINSAIVRIDAATGSHSVLVDLTSPGSVRQTLTWDPFRNRLLGAQTTSTGGLMAIDGSGNVTFPAPALSTPRIVASRGSGIVYLWTTADSLRYLDAADAPHDLLDIPGTGPYTVAVIPTAMIYDPGTNALFLFQGAGSVTTLCTDGTATCVIKIPLTADGTQVAAVETFAQVDVSTSDERPSGASYAPGGQLLVIVDTNSNAQEPRMLLIDPTTLGISTWASNGSYVGAASTNAGSYSSVRGQAVILDTFNDHLRAFSFGETGSGTSLGSGLSTFGSGELAYMVEIILAPAAVPGLSVGGLLLLAAGVGTIAGVALLRRAELRRR
jgi:hypothetical protein